MATGSFVANQSTIGLTAFGRGGSRETNSDECVVLGRVCGWVDAGRRRYRVVPQRKDRGSRCDPARESAGCPDDAAQADVEILRQ